MTAVRSTGAGVAGERRQWCRSSARHASALAAGAAALCVAIAAADDQSAQPAAQSADRVAATPVVTTISQQQLVERLAAQDATVFLLDVRSPEEFAAGHIPGAVNIPYDGIADHLADVPKDKDVVLYCRSGRRAGIAAGVLAENGYARIGHLEGDMQAWVAQGHPVSAPIP